MQVANSMAWWAKSDNGITLHRDEDRRPMCKIWKVRWGWLGKPQTIPLNHNEITGCFSRRVPEKVDWSFAEDL